MKTNMRKSRGEGELIALGFIVMIILLVTLIVVGIKSCAPQSRMKSRLGGKPVVVQLPADCPNFDAVKNICYDQGEKNVTYLSSDGQLKTKTYTDWGLLQGEVVYGLSTEVKSEKSE